METQNSANSKQGGDSISPAELRFTGSGQEYFRIWIVNILLTILTLGIYSAWAKVRTKQYFYANTHLQSSAFEYLGNPVAILKGRLIAAGLFILYFYVEDQLASNPLDRMWLSIYIGMLVLFMLLMPFIITKALMFRARVTSYRNVRFRFTQSYWQAYKVYLLWYLLFYLCVTVALYLLVDRLPPLRNFSNSTLIAGVIGSTKYQIAGIIILVLSVFSFAFIWHQQRLFIIKNMHYGTTTFFTTVSFNRFLVLFLQLLGIVTLSGFIVALHYAYILFPIIGIVLPGEEQTILLTNIALVVSAGTVYILAYTIPFAHYQAKINNLTWNYTDLDKRLRFSSNLTTWGLVRIYINNTLLIVITLGVYLPWAKVSLAKYRISKTKVFILQDLDQFVADVQSKQQKALGEGMVDVFDVDLGL